jgi:three-Cys-motif partner protein
LKDSDGLPLDEVGPWAKEKHDRLRKYLDASRAARRKFTEGSGGSTYVDLFSGAGRAIIRDTDELIDGSPIVAFKTAAAGKAPFSSIHLADLEANKVEAALKRLRAAGGDASTAVGEAEKTVQEIVTRLNPYGLHFVFLDPFNLAALPFSVIKTSRS